MAWIALPLAKESKIDRGKIKTKHETYEQKLHDLPLNLSGVD